VHHDQGNEAKRKKDYVPSEHLAEVQDVEERPDAYGIEPVLGLSGDPLVVEVLL
jgi:hypothetical protein